jgi:hypothetical protein
MTNIAESVCAEASPAVLPEPPRCQFVFADARRCRMPALCAAHARAQAAKETPLAAEPAEAIDLAPLSGEFTTATEINRALGKVFLLLAGNRIPRRNAVALGYIAQLLLQTLPAVRQEIVSVCGQESWQETLESAVCEEDAQGGTNNGEAASTVKTEPEDKTGRVDSARDDSEEAPAVLAPPISRTAAGTTCSPQEATALGSPPEIRRVGDSPIEAFCAAPVPPEPKSATRSSPGYEKRIEGPASSAPGSLPMASAAAQPVHPARPPAAAAESKSIRINTVTAEQLFRNEHLHKKGGRGVNLLLPNRNGRRIWCGNGRPFRMPG